MLFVHAANCDFAIFDLVFGTIKVGNPKRAENIQSIWLTPRVAEIVNAQGEERPAHFAHCHKRALRVNIEKIYVRFGSYECTTFLN